MQDGAILQAEPYRAEAEARVRVSANDFNPVQIQYAAERLENDVVKEVMETKEQGFSYQQELESHVSGEQIFDSLISGLLIGPEM